ncbi:MAG: protein kinase [Acidobacteria bacterium]|nr:protein kinase [Acidobacteriota bacterium]
MPLAPGLRLGPYEIVGLIGAGAMGEVWRARDPRLGRDVAIKVLPESMSRDPERLARFTREAQILASLSHPNIGAIHGLEEADGVRALVLEIVEGPTLGERLRGGPIPLDEALPLAIGVAGALEAAHERGIVHRDLKPDNVKITAQGQAKVLDFGVARALAADTAAPAEHAQTLTSLDTGAGVILGTPAYMSPEQARGKPADRRTDIWAFGALLYEMLTGRRAFGGETASDAMASVLRGEADLGLLPGETPVALRALIRRCLVKDPVRRLQAIGDARIVLEEVASGAAPDAPAGKAPGPAARRNPLAGPVALAAALALGLAAGWLLHRPARPAHPAYTQLTYERGRINHARFAPDGTVIYSAGWSGRPIDVFSKNPGTPGSRALDLTGSALLAVSANGELALARNSRLLAHFLNEGMLARAPVAGGAPRDVLENVQEADWDPRTGELAIVRRVGELIRLEFPVGKVLYETSGWLSNPRFSPDGGQIAFAEHTATRYDDRGRVLAVGREGGAPTLLTPGYYTLEGLAWRPDGKEIWYTAGERVRTLLATDLRGKIRPLGVFPVEVTLRDIARDGRVLLTIDGTRRSVIAHAAEGPGERDVSWLDQSTGAGISADGGAVVMFEERHTGEQDEQAVLRRLADPLPVLLGPGSPVAISPDARWVLASDTPGGRLQLMPTGAGTTRALKLRVKPDGTGGFTPDGAAVLFGGRDGERPPRIWRLPIDAAAAEQPVTPEGTTAPSTLQPLVVSPDGQTIVVADGGGTLFACPLGSDDPLALRPIPGLEPGESPLQWSADGRALYVTRLRLDHARVFRVDVRDGTRTLAREITQADPGGLEFYGVFVTPDARGWAYTFKRLTSDLFLVEGLD